LLNVLLQLANKKWDSNQKTKKKIKNTECHKKGMKTLTNANKEVGLE
jgi:hypothetical protein